MEPKKSQGPSRVAVAGSAVVVCAVLIGASYWLRDDSPQATGEPSPLAASKLQTLYDRCDGGPTEDVVDGRTRTRCETRAHPAFMMEVIGDGDEIESAKMLVPLRGSMNQLLDRMLVGLEMFGLVAGVRADRFLPKEYMDAIGTSKTSLVFEERVYTTQPVANVGLVFSVTPPGAEAEPAPPN